MNDNTRSLQETYAPNNRCFGCGPANEKGLRIRSFPVEGNPEELEAEWTPADHHEAFEGILNGGIVADAHQQHVHTLGGFGRIPAGTDARQNGCCFGQSAPGVHPQRKAR